MDKVLNLLGLARRSGHLIIGTDRVISSMQQGKVHLILLASDASTNTIDKLIKKAYFYQIEVVTSYDASSLQQATGSKTLVYALNDAGFAKAIQKEINLRKVGDQNEG